MVKGNSLVVGTNHEDDVLQSTLHEGSAEDLKHMENEVFSLHAWCENVQLAALSLPSGFNRPSEPSRSPRAHLFFGVSKLLPSWLRVEVFVSASLNVSPVSFPFSCISSYDLPLGGPLHGSIGRN